MKQMYAQVNKGLQMHQYPIIYGNSFFTFIVCSGVVTSCGGAGHHAGHGHGCGAGSGVRDRDRDRDRDMEDDADKASETESIGAGSGGKIQREGDRTT